MGPTHQRLRFLGLALGPEDHGFPSKLRKLLYITERTSPHLAFPVPSRFPAPALLHLARQRSLSWPRGGDFHISWLLMVWLAGKDAAIIYSLSLLGCHRLPACHLQTRPAPKFKGCILELLSILKPHSRLYQWHSPPVMSPLGGSIAFSSTLDKTSTP